MNVIAAKDKLLKALSFCNGVVEKRSTIPVLSHVLLNAKNDNLTITATDMDMAVIVTMPVQVNTIGSICVSAGLLYDIVRKLSEKNPINITLNNENLQLTIQSGRSLFTLNGIQADDFPTITQTELTHHLNLPAQQFIYLIDHSKFAIDTSDINYHLGGIFIHTKLAEDNSVLLSVAATDMHRMANLNIHSPVPEIPSIIVGRKAINEIRKLLADQNDADIKFSLSTSRVEINIQKADSNIIFSSRLIEGNFPDYEGSLIIENPTKIIINTKNFLEAIDRVSTVVNDKDRAVRLNIHNNLANLMPVGAGLGGAIEEFDVDFSSSNKIEFCFNVDYLMDIVKQIDNEEVVLSVGGSEGQVLFQPVNDNHQFYLLMPLIA